MQGFLAKLSIRHQLWALFGLFLLTGVGVLVIDEIAQYRERQVLQSLRDDSLQRLRHIQSMADAYGQDIVDTTFRVRNHLIPWQEGVAVVDAARSRIERDWTALVRMPRDARQQALFTEIAQTRSRADRAAAELRGILVRRDLAALSRFADTELYPAIDPVTKRCQQLSDLAKLQADALVRRHIRESRWISALRTGVSFFALLAVALIGRHVLRNAYRSIESLAWLAGRMREHDYTAVPQFQPRGELATVMDAFTEMRREVLDFETRLIEQLARNEEGRAELERRERFQRSLLDAAQVAILAMDSDGHWIVFNPFAERMLGWRADEVLGRVPRYGGPPQADDSPLLVPPADIESVIGGLSRRLGHVVPTDWRAMYELADLRRAPGEAQLLHKDGHAVPVLMAFAVSRDEQGRRTGLIAVASDLTERKRLESELRNSEARAQQANQAKSAFLAAMSHEIRTPMIGVTGMIEILAHSSLDPDQRRALNVIQESSQSLLRIIGDILDFSKIEAGRLELSPIATDVAALVRSTVANYAGSASSKGLRLEAAVDPRVAAAHYADPLRLRQILSNFLSNAIKFTEAGAIEVVLEWHGQTAPEDGSDRGTQQLCLRVTDTGIGVGLEQQQKLFEPFSQAEGDTTRRFGGTGLGLAICRRLAELMGGGVSMQSAPGQGTTMRFTLTLPIADAAEIVVEPLTTAPASGFVPRPLPTVEQAERERSLVLLVDDHPTNRMVIARQLALAGYACETAEEGLSGLARWRSGRYALLLSDIHMPGLDGYALARAVREDEQRSGAARAPIVALSASALKGDAERCLEAGMDDYLAKPVSVPVLATCMQRWLPHTVVAADAAVPAAATVIDEGGGGHRAPATTIGPAPAPAPAAPAPLAQLQQPPLLDLALLEEITGGDATEISALLDDYLASTVQDVTELDAARAAGDAPALTRQAHKLKGAAKLVGALELTEVAARLEAAGREADWAQILPLAADVATAVERLRLYVAERTRH